MPAITDDTLIRYCQTVYDALVAEATVIDGVRVWEGRYVELFSRLGISNAQYSNISSVLQNAGCIETLQRGARGTSTKIALYRRPELIDLDRGTSGLTNPSAHGRLELRIEQLERRLEGIDVKTYLTHLEKRLRAVEGKDKGK